MTTAPTPDVLERLAERAEKASGPDRELDLAIHLALWPDSDLAKITKYPRCLESQEGYAWTISGASVVFEKWVEGRCPVNGGYPLAAYSASLDAAMTLVSEGWSARIAVSENRKHAQATLGRSYPTNKMIVQEASTMALALVIASLRAKAALAQELGR